MNVYIAFYRGKKHEVKAETIYAAQIAATAHFKAKKSWEVAVVPAMIGGEKVAYHME